MMSSKSMLIENTKEHLDLRLTIHYPFCRNSIRIQNIVSRFKILFLTKYSASAKSLK